MTIKAVIFDWDGVLNNSLKGYYKAYLSVVKKFGLPIFSLTAFRQLWQSDYRSFEKKIGITQNKRELSDKIWFNAYRQLKGDIDLFPGAKDFLLKIKIDYKIGLVTVGTSGRIEYEIERYQLNKVFDAIVTSDEVNKLKPDPEALNLCTEKLDVNSGDCVYIGDSKGDILAAKNGGVTSVFVTWGFHDVLMLKDVQPKRTVNSFDELYEVLKK